MMARIRPLDVVFAVSVVLIWTFFLVSARQGVKTTFTPWDMAFLRFSFATLSVLPIFLMRPAGQRFGALSLPQAFVIAMLAGIGFTCLAYIGFSYAPAAHGAVLMPGTLPFSAAIVAWALLGDRITQRKALGLSLIFLGVLFTCWHSLSDGASGSWRGDFIFPLASLCWAFFTVLTRKWRVSAIDAVVATPILSLMVFVPVYLLFLPKQLLAAPMSDIIMQGFVQGVLALSVSMWFFTKVVQAFGPTRTTMITAVCPGLAALVSVPMLGEPLVPLVMLGLLAVTTGMIVGVTGASPTGAISKG